MYFKVKIQNILLHIGMGVLNLQSHHRKERIKSWINEDNAEASSASSAHTKSLRLDVDQIVEQIVIWRRKTTNNARIETSKHKLKYEHQHAIQGSSHTDYQRCLSREEVRTPSTAYRGVVFCLSLAMCQYASCLEFAANFKKINTNSCVNVGRSSFSTLRHWGIFNRV